MSFNNWLSSSSSSSSTSRQPLSTTTTVPPSNFNDIKQQHHHYYHYHYHYHYAPMTITFAHPLSIHCQHQCQENVQPSKTLTCPTVMPMIDHQVPLKYKENIHRNSTLKLRRCVNLFLHLIDNSTISDFLQYDEHFRHADKYLLAMVLIYFWRAKLREHHFTKDSFYLALWLAHDSVEEDLSAKYGLLPWALRTHDGRPSMDLKNDFKRFLTKKNDLWTRMGFRARVTKEDCDEIILIQPNHWIWQRERSMDYNKRMATSSHRSNKMENSCSSSCSTSPIDDTNSCNQSTGQSVPLNISMDARDDDEDC